MAELRFQIAIRSRENLLGRSWHKSRRDLPESYLSQRLSHGGLALWAIATAGVIFVVGGPGSYRIPLPPSAPGCTIAPDASTIQRGQSVNLKWSGTNATDIVLLPGVGEVQVSGSRLVTPEDTTTYTLTATGSGGTVTCKAAVTVRAPPPPASAEELFNRTIKDAYFDSNSSDLRPDAAQALTDDADFLKAHLEINFTIEGRCSEEGSQKHNLILGGHRAASARDFLIGLGVSSDRINIISYGKDRPFCTERNEECGQKNRGAHFVFRGESK